MKNALLTIFVFFLFASFLTDVSAQRGQRGGGRGRRERANAPPAAAPGATPAAATTAAAGLGEVPKLASPPGSVAPLEVVDFDESQSMIPPRLPNKVLRYASGIFDKYDLNKNGFLERDEWLKMPGKPQSIDTDGDFVITLEEFIRFIALYGNVRTIHRPNPPQMQARVDVSRFQVFRPLSAPFPPPQTQSAESQTKAESTEKDAKLDENKIVGAEPEDSADDSKDESVDDSTTEESPTDATKTEGEEDESDEDDLDDLTYEKVFEGKFKPSERKYHVPLRELRGVPNWFVLRDKNGDGQLTLVEYDPTLSPVGLANFGRMDKNRDGFLSADEVREALKKKQ